MAADCIFCKIVRGEIPVRRLHEDEYTLGFPDIHPQAPVHLLLVPKTHISSHAATGQDETELLGHLMTAAAELARASGLEKGYRLVVNTGPDGGQTVDHLHVHILGGRHMTWPPG